MEKIVLVKEVFRNFEFYDKIEDTEGYPSG